MSRTIRRTRTSKGSCRHLSLLDDYLTTEARFNDWMAQIEKDRNDPIRWRWLARYYHRWALACDTYEQYCIKKTARFHADDHPGKYTPPKWWVNEECNRPLRREHKAQIRAALSEDDAWDGLSLTPYRSNKKWWFW